MRVGSAAVALTQGELRSGFSDPGAPLDDETRTGSRHSSGTSPLDQGNHISVIRVPALSAGRLSRGHASWGIGVAAARSQPWNTS